LKQSPTAFASEPSSVLVRPVSLFVVPTRTETLLRSSVLLWKTISTVFTMADKVKNSR
jgi:hypothetical protein